MTSGLALLVILTKGTLRTYDVDVPICTVDIVGCFTIIGFSFTGNYINVLQQSSLSLLSHLILPQ